MTKRFDELDSLRGLAAVSVVFHHLSLVTMNIGYLFGLLAITPIHVFWAGHAAVIFFFILSGFVLSIPYHNGHRIPYKIFIIKRMTRIYIPYYFAVMIAVTCCALFSRHGIPQLGNWFNMVWEVSLTPSLIMSHIILVGNFQNYAYDPVIWSLIHEMRISVIFPILVWLVRRLKWGTALSIGIMLSLIAYGCKFYTGLEFKEAVDYGSSFTDTIHYAAMFMIGIMLAQHRNQLVTRFRVLSKRRRKLVLFGGLLFYTYPYWGPAPRLHEWILDDWTIAIGASAFIVVSLGSERVSRMLLYRPVHFTGRMSYSLYLYHTICILTLFNALYEKIPMWLIYLFALPCIAIISLVAYYGVERPSIWLTKKVREKREFTLDAGTLLNKSH